MTVDYNDGKIHGWNGGECPVNPETKVHAWFESGRNNEEFAGDLEWSDDLKQANVIAFRVVKVFKEPNTIWVNESEGIIYGAYLSEEAARRTTYPNTTRVAIKYQEVIEDE